MQDRYARTRLACYATNVTMSVVSGLPPLLFLTFRERFGVSWALLGTLVLINYCTQLAVDLVFSFFSHRFNIEKTVRVTPVIACAGLVLFSALPLLFPGAAYLGLAIGTVIFSAASGLGEVLISPSIAAMPSPNPERDMSLLHSIFAWGVVAVVVLSTLLLRLVGGERWWLLPLIWALVPLTGSLLFAGAPMPKLSGQGKASNVLRLFRNPALLLCVVAIFVGGATECTMSQWSSSYLESALGIPKIWGDIGGVAMFAVMLGLGRTLYSRRGKNIVRVLLAGMSAAVVCYLTASLSPSPVLGLAACALTGLCASMLWPGSLIVMADLVPGASVSAYALMAAGGDLGASVAPQLVGLIADAAAVNPGLVALGERLGLDAAQIGMKAGLLTATVFPLIGVAVVLAIRARRK